MSVDLLEGKLNIPARPQTIVPRERLVQALEQGAGRHKLTLITAPAGYGKTTLVTDWARASSLPVAWLTVTGEEGDPLRFLRYLLAAWSRVEPAVTETPLGALLGSFMPDLRAVLAAFANAGEQLPTSLAFVLDDYQLIANPAIHEAVAFLLDHLPSHLHFILTSRSEPPLPVARYRARGQLFELGAGDLHFTPEESAGFLGRFPELDLSPAEIENLQVGAEGWAAGLQLAALSLRGRPAGLNGPAPISGRQPFIADYLAGEVLAQQPAAVQDFLLKTSLLDQLSASLCARVTAGPTGQAGAQAALEYLERANLFLVPLDDRREWFRYHSLFAEFLQFQLNQQMPEEVTQLHKRAAAWYIDHDLPEPAFRHALAAGDAGQVLQIVEYYVPLKLISGEFSLLAHWIESLPEAWFRDYPMLGFGRAAFLLHTGEPEAALRGLEEVEQALLQRPGAEAERIKARVSAARCGVACYQNNLAAAKTFAEKARQELPPEDVFYHALIRLALGDTYRQNGLWEQSQEHYLQLLSFAHTPYFRYLAVHTYGALADLDLRQGKLRSAAAYWQKALDTIATDRESVPLPLAGWVDIRMGEILYEWNRLAEAGEHVRRGLESAGLGGDTQSQIAGLLAMGRLKLTEGDIQAAAAYLDQARPMVEQAPFLGWASRFESLQLELWLAQDQPRAAVRWADALLSGSRLRERPESGTAQLAAARALIVSRDPPTLKRAQGLLDDLIQAAQAEGRTGETIHALALRALAAWQVGDPPAALAHLEQALRLAEPEGYTRLFADLGLPMARLLQEARSRDVRVEMVGRLLAAFSPDLDAGAPAAARLPEPLTPRELEILELIAAGLTNSEIAGRLVISPGTVKKHTGNIYAKFGVGSRTQAVAQARSLDLIE